MGANQAHHSLHPVTEFAYLNLVATRWLESTGTIKPVRESMKNILRFVVFFSLCILLPTVTAVGFFLGKTRQFVFINLAISVLLVASSLVLYQLIIRHESRRRRFSGDIVKAWMHLSEELTNLTDYESLGKFISHEIGPMLGVEQSALYLFQENGDLERLNGSGMGPERISAVASNRLPASGGPGLSWARLVVPVAVQGNVLGYWVLSEAKVRYEQHHIKMLEQLTGSIGAALVLISQRQSLAEQMQLLLKNERMAALGRMAASIGHQINNPLQVIVGSLDAYCEYETGGPSDRWLGQAYRSALHLKNIVRSVSLFTRPSSLEMAVVDTNENVTQVIGLVSNALNERGIAVQVELSPERPLLRLPPSDLLQVLSNLIDNARDAMPDGGVLTITTAVHDAMVMITVGDTGSGIQPEHLPNIFEPFYTTKHDGSGFGLTIAYSIIERNDGAISVQSEPEKGSIFQIALPQYTQETPDENTDR